jgi:SAM-dependent methyltransferase
MDEATARRLSAINRAFYETAADDFDASRAAAWGGWRWLLPVLRPLTVAPLTALDVGCGNGRFGVFLAESLRCQLIYHGVDSSAALLARARAALSGRANVSAAFSQLDLLDAPRFDGTYRLIALIAVLHHIPGRARRAALVRALAERVEAGGLLIFTTWRFHEFPRFQRRLLPWDADLAGRVEPGDCLLDWRRGRRAAPPALRYCHAIDDEEEAELISASGLRPILRFRADGENDRANSYAVLRRT